MLSYLKCIKSHRGTNDDECRNLSKSYLSCRMDRCVAAFCYTFRMARALVINGILISSPLTGCCCLEISWHRIRLEISGSAMIAMSRARQQQQPPLRRLNLGDKINLGHRKIPRAPSKRSMSRVYLSSDQQRLAKNKAIEYDYL